MLFVPPSMSSMVPDAFAQTPLTLILDPLPSTVQAGDTITFSGILLTADQQYYIPNETIYIKDDVSFGSDIVMGTVITSNEDGTFSATWTATPRSDGGSYDFFAVFEGTSDLGYARSQEYSVTVTQATTPTAPTGPTPLKLVLDPLSSTVQEGDTITFSGILLTADEQYYIPNETIYIKDDVTLGADTVIGTLTTSSQNGRFSATWTATPRSDGGAYDFFAVFEGTSSYGYAKSQEYSVTVIETATTAPQFYGTKIILDPLPTNVNKGDTITFSGILLTADEQYYIPNETIYIKDDVTLGADTVIGTLTTSSEDGTFSGTWTAVPRSGGGSYDFFAVFEGTSSYGYAKSQEYAVSVIGPTESTPPTIGGKYYTELVLNQIPAAVYSTQSVTFSGQLTSNGQPLANALVYIKEDDPLLPDQFIANGKTNSNGMFSIPWRVTPGLVEIDFDIYAVFEGDSTYARAVTTTQQMKVEKYWSEVSLHPFPQSVNIGDMVIFSGTVKLEKGSPEGFVVYIKDEDPLSADDLMATAYVNRDGSFTANWLVRHVDPGVTADVYAVLEATELYYRSTTCDPSGITFDFGGSCENTIPIQITGVMLPTPEPTPEREIPAEKFDGDEYIEYYFTHNFKKNPLVAIVPQPDSYDKVRSSLIPAQEGVLIWASMLEKRNDGNWDVDFEIVAPGNTFSQRPDIIMNVVWYDKQLGACGDIRGYAQLGPGIYKTGQPINTVVCASIYGVGTSDAEVSNIAAHEFVHAIGLGHAFNKPGDLMCSTEGKRPSGFAGGPTCGYGASISELSRFLVVRSPSDMDIATVEHIYNKDGFKTPNQNVEVCGGYCIPRFTIEDYQSSKESGFEQEEKPPTTPTPTIHSTVLTLDSIPSKVKAGDEIHISGTLKTTDGSIVKGETVTIKSIKLGVIGTLETDNNGKFAGTWEITQNIGVTYDLFAVYDGSANTKNAQSQLRSVTVTSSTPTPTPTPTPTQQSDKEIYCKKTANNLQDFSDCMNNPSTPTTTPTPTPTPQSKGGGCLIATAAFGSEMAPQVQLLRELRDNTVLQTESGSAFMTGFNQFYYSFSPAIADYERENPAFKEAVKLTLTPLLSSLTLLQYADIDSESEMLGYGIGIILLNIGMYFVAPAVLIMAVRKRISK